MIRARFLCRALAALACSVAAHTAVAQDSPANGKPLFENTPVAAGRPTLQACVQCHLTVQNRRDAIDPGGDLDFDLVFARFTNAIAVQGVMNQFNVLSTQQKRDIAAYIADVPKARPNLVDFSASAINTETAATSITFANAVTATTPLSITSVGVTGASSTDFLIKTPATTCGTSVVLQPGQTCVVSVTFRTATAAAKVGLLSVIYSQSGASTTRTAQLSGTVAGQPGGGGGGSSSSGGGGALAPGALGLALLALGLRRRR